MLGAVPSACSARTWATLTWSMRVAPLFQQTLGGLKVGVDRRLAAHGFDEFFGNLYHLNAEEEPENPDYPTEEEAPLMRAALLPRRHPLLGHRHRLRRGRSPLRSGGQAARRRHRSAQPQAHGDHRRRDDGSVRRLHAPSTRLWHTVFVWMNTTHMHFRTHTKPESLGQAGRWQSPITTP